MTAQKRHLRISKNGKPFPAGHKVVYDFWALYTREEHGTIQIDASTPEAAYNNLDEGNILDEWSEGSIYHFTGQIMDSKDHIFNFKPYRLQRGAITNKPSIPGTNVPTLYYGTYVRKENGGALIKAANPREAYMKLIQGKIVEFEDNEMKSTYSYGTTLVNGTTGKTIHK